MDTEKLQAGFVRNRRFLIATSLTLAFTQLLGIEFKQVSLLGNSADIPYPHQVIWILWTIWAWSIAQYVVWYVDVGAWKEFRQAVADDCAHTLGEAAAKKDLPQWLQDALAAQVGTQLKHSSYSDLLMSIKYHSWYTEMHGNGKDKTRIANVVSQAYVRLPDQRGEVTSTDIRIEVEILDEEWRRAIQRSTLKKLLTSRFLLEYFAPYVIGLIPVAVSVFRQFVRPIAAHP
jgi:hypothetical protein